MAHRLDSRSPDFEARFADFLHAKREAEADVDHAVAGILAEVKARGDDAVIDLTERFDRIRLGPTELAVAEDELAAAEAACSQETLEALALAAERITDYHRRQLPADLDYRDSQGIRLGHRWTPVAAAGLYVPGGTAAYPSSV